MAYKCEKCEGKGEIAAFRGVMGGVCFKCNGTGEQAKKPAAKSQRYSCIYNGQPLFTKRAKTEAQALKLAIQHWVMNREAPAMMAVESESDIRVELDQ
jgi:hypothetical protein